MNAIRLMEWGTVTLSAQNDSKGEPSPLLTEPWVFAVVFFTVSMIALGSIWYGFLMIAGNVIGLLPVVILLVWFHDYTDARLLPEFPTQFAPAALPAAFWLLIVILFGGGGLYNYLPYFLDDLVLSILITLGPILILDSVISDRPLVRSDVGLVVPSSTISRVSVFTIAVLYLPIIVYALLTPEVSSLGAVNWFNLIVLYAVRPAISEEIAFRGILQQSLSAKHGSRWSGLVLASLLFGLVHVFTNKASSGDIIIGFMSCFGAQFLAGLVFGALYDATGSLIPSMLLHFFGNLLVGIIEVASLDVLKVLFVLAAVLVGILFGIAFLFWDRRESVGRIAWKLQQWFRKPCPSS